MQHENWKKGVDYPEWAGGNYIQTVTDGYLGKDETPYQAYKRLAKTAANHLRELDIIGLEDKLFNIFWKGWFIPSTPVMANFGTNNGLPVSCQGSVMDDSMDSIFEKVSEIALMSKNGCGTSVNLENIRPKGSLIRGGAGGKSNGKLPFMKVLDSTVAACLQSNIRRGAIAMYDDIESPDLHDFMRAITPLAGEFHCPNTQIGVMIKDDFMYQLPHDLSKKERFKDVIKHSIEHGKPYKIFSGNVDKAIPGWWPKHIKVRASNLC